MLQEAIQPAVQLEWVDPHRRPKPHHGVQAVHDGHERHHGTDEHLSRVFAKPQRDENVQNGTVTFRPVFYPSNQGVEELHRSERSGLRLIRVV
jgi:hypothetical protein